jgi:Tfp pilus assembly protein PilV
MARISRTSPTERLASESGSLLIEVLVAAAILIGGIAGTVAAFDSTTRASHTAEREAEAVSIAEKELERVVSKPFAQINDCTTPSAGTGRSDDPQSWVQNGQFFVARNFRPTGSSGSATPPPADLSSSNELALESFAVSNTTGCVLPLEDASASGVTNDSKIAHTKLFRFITNVGAQCASNLATSVSGTLTGSAPLLGTLSATLNSTTTTDLSALCGTIGVQQAKRVTIAVVLNQLSNNAGLRYPVYVSTLVADPNASLHVSTGNVLSAP